MLCVTQVRGPRKDGYAMPPSALSADFLRVMAALAKLVVLAAVLERALVLLFDWRWYEKTLSGKGLKVPIVYAFSWTICHFYGFDVLSELFEPGKPTLMGISLTAAIAAGGSAGAITLFQIVFSFSKEAQGKLREAKLAEAEARTAVARARKKKAMEGGDGEESIPETGIRNTGSSE